MTVSFALIAYSATYADSGIMTFTVNQDGIVFQKNFGPDKQALRARSRDTIRMRAGKPVSHDSNLFLGVGSWIGL